MATTSRRKWRFAPLSTEWKTISDKPTLKGIVFDVDGTLCSPQNYMFVQMREALGIPKSVDILDHIHALPEPEQEGAHEKIRNIERSAMVLQTPVKSRQPGLAELMNYIQEKGIRHAICTRNFEEPVNHLLSNFIVGHAFEPIVTRSFKPPKPDPAGILHIAKEWGIDENDRARDCVMVGDSLDDMRAGGSAGAMTVLLESDANQHLKEHECTDVVVTRLDHLIQILERGELDVD